MKIKFTKKISCNNPVECTERIKKIFDDQFGVNIEGGATWHFSIYHENNNHTIWLFFYDKDGRHESERHRKTITEKLDIIRKYTGPILSEKEIEKLI